MGAWRGEGRECRGGLGLLLWGEPQRKKREPRLGCSEAPSGGAEGNRLQQARRGKGRGQKVLQAVWGGGGAGWTDMDLVVPPVV